MCVPVPATVGSKLPATTPVPESVPPVGVGLNACAGSPAQNEDKAESATWIMRTSK